VMLAALKSVSGVIGVVPWGTPLTPTHVLYPELLSHHSAAHSPLAYRLASPARRVCSRPFCSRQLTITMSPPDLSRD
jgi:hypothetical protein